MIFFTLDLRPRKFTLKSAEELTEWLEKEESVESGQDSEYEDLKENKIPENATPQSPCFSGATPESAFKGSPNLRMGVKRTINSPVTIKKLLPIKVMKKTVTQRKPVGIKKANSKILTSTPCRKVIGENHEKKMKKRENKAEVEKKMQEVKKEILKQNRQEKKKPKPKAVPKQKEKPVKKKKIIQRTGRRPRQKKIPDNPKL